MIRAIETRYKGYRFRSRLEARWAVFFDALGIQWEYEPEGFETAAGRYLPDFKLTFKGAERFSVIYVEVKAGPGTQEDDWMKAKQLSRHHYVVLLAGAPALGRRDTLCGPDDHHDFDEPWLYFTDPAIEYKSCPIHFIPQNFITCCAFSCGCEVCDGKYELDIANAVMAARGARFEFGESGVTA